MSKMINYLDIQLKYNALYLQLSNYFWNYDSVEAIADLESEAYKVFPNIIELKKKLEKVGSVCKAERSEDEELQKAYKTFLDCLKDQESTYAKLDKPIGVL